MEFVPFSKVQREEKIEEKEYRVEIRECCSHKWERMVKMKNVKVELRGVLKELRLLLFLPLTSRRTSVRRW